MAVTKGSILTTTWHVNDRTGRRLLTAWASTYTVHPRENDRCWTFPYVT